MTTTDQAKDTFIRGWVITKPQLNGTKDFETFISFKVLGKEGLTGTHSSILCKIKNPTTKVIDYFKHNIAINDYVLINGKFEKYDYYNKSYIELRISVLVLINEKTNKEINHLII